MVVKDVMGIFGVTKRGSVAFIIQEANDSAVVHYKADHEDEAIAVIINGCISTDRYNLSPENTIEALEIDISHITNYGAPSPLLKSTSCFLALYNS